MELEEFYTVSLMKKNADLILEMVLQSSEHMTAEEIHAALLDGGHRMALATVTATWHSCTAKDTSGKYVWKGIRTGMTK